MLTKPLLVTPDAGVINHYRIRNAVRFVIYPDWRVGVDHLDPSPVADELLIGMINGDRALERTVYRVAAEQAGSLLEIVNAFSTQYDGSQLQYISTTRFFYQQPGNQPTDASKTIEHDVLRRSQRFLPPIRQWPNFVA